MPILQDLLPELGRWNNGTGIAVDEWIWIVGQSDQALGYCSLFWPEFGEFEGYLLRTPIDVDRLRDWEAAGRTRQQIETAMNASFLDGAFPREGDSGALKDARLDHLAKVMADMWDTKLRRAFPNRPCSAFVINNGDDLGVSFHQI